MKIHYIGDEVKLRNLCNSQTSSDATYELSRVNCKVCLMKFNRGKITLRGYKRKEQNAND